MKNTLLSLAIICNLLLLYGLSTNKKEYQNVTNKLQADLYAQKMSRIMETNYSIYHGEETLKKLEQSEVKKNDVINEINFFIEYQKRQKRELDKELNIKLNMDANEFIKNIRSSSSMKTHEIKEIK